MGFLSANAAWRKQALRLLECSIHAFIWVMVVMLSILGTGLVEDLLRSSSRGIITIDEFLKGDVSIGPLSLVSLLLLVEWISTHDLIPTQIQWFTTLFSLAGIVVAVIAIKNPEFTVSIYWVMLSIIPLVIYRTVVLLAAKP